MLLLEHYGNITTNAVLTEILYSSSGYGTFDLCVKYQVLDILIKIFYELELYLCFSVFNSHIAVYVLYLIFK